MQSILVKQYVEERSHPVILMVDVSASTKYGSEEKYQKIVWIANVMLFIAAYSGDHVGLILYTDAVEKYMPPRAGISYARLLVRTLLEYVPYKNATALCNACAPLTVLKERSLVCIVSDFIDSQLEVAIRRIIQRHEGLAIRYLDPCERSLPVPGFLMAYDEERGASYVLDFSKGSMHYVQHCLSKRILEQDTIFKKYGVSVLDTLSQRTFIRELVALFSTRMYS
jgi:uncharacterized protein (DUF58 family)